MAQSICTAAVLLAALVLPASATLGSNVAAGIVASSLSGVRSQDVLATTNRWLPESTAANSLPNRGRIGTSDRCV